MADIIALSALYASSIGQVVLLGVALFFCVRIYRNGGSFAAWTLIMTSFALIVGNDLLSFVTLVSLPATTLDSLLSSFSPTAIWVPQILNLASSTALAVGMLGLSRIFKPRPKKELLEPTATASRT